MIRYFKHCPACNDYYPASPLYFYHNSAKWDGLDGYCIPCAKAKAIARAKKKPRVTKHAYNPTAHKRWRLQRALKKVA